MQYCAIPKAVIVFSYKISSIISIIKIMQPEYLDNLRTIYFNRSLG